MSIPTEPISGSAYPPLSGKPGFTTYQNPPFHPNILNIGGANTAINPKASVHGGDNFKGQLQRGRLVGGAGAYFGSSTNISYIVNFLYNPASIYESRGIDMNNAVLPSTAKNYGDPGQYATGLNTAINFSLLFDRTFELWDSSYSSSLAGIYGCRADVEALFNLCGVNQVTQTTASIPSVAKGGSVSEKLSVVVQGPMVVSPCNLYFGSSGIGPLSYYGFVSEMDVTWTHFTSSMIPARCTVDISFTALPTSTSNYTIGG